MISTLSAFANIAASLAVLLRNIERRKPGSAQHACAVATKSCGFLHILGATALKCMTSSGLRRLPSERVNQSEDGSGRRLGRTRTMWSTLGEPFQTLMHEDESASARLPECLCDLCGAVLLTRRRGAAVNEKLAASAEWTQRLRRRRPRTHPAP